jgi:TPR repeat protein
MRALGDQRLKQGDVATARLFYERAADGGDGPAALRLGNTLDPNYLSHWGVLGLQPDVAAAAKWYRRARDLGEAAADLDLAALPQQ